MKIIFLAPGLARIKRGTERFILELSAQLRESGLDATIWGTSEAPGIEAIPVPARVELQKFAFEHLQSAPKLSPIPASAFEDWSIYAEDQLFAIPAAARITKVLDQGESLLVYARWQGGFVDPSGAPTDLMKTLAVGARDGKASLLIHTDYIYSPIDSLLWASGAFFHSLGPWITEPLRQMDVVADAITELPMCVHGAPYRNARDRRASARAEFGIPQDAFVILSVGAFDTTTPDKRHGHTLEEIRKLPREAWWIVAGSRGPVPAAWERDARQAFGSRFAPLTNLSFDKMPRLYGAADVLVSASLSETFGLVYLEAQMAGLPVVIHDSPVTQYICAKLPDAFKGISLIDMRRPGAAAAAISRWITLLASPNEGAGARAILDAFARTQERQFSWKFVTPRYAAAFEQLMRSAADRERGNRQDFRGWDEQLHKRGLRLFEQGKHAEALVALSKILGGRETAERWNDWATIQSALANSQESEQGFRRALALDPNHAQAAANLGAVLASQNRLAEAIPVLKSSLAGLDEKERLATAALLDACEARQGQEPSHDEAEIRQFFEKRLGRQATADPLSRERIAYCTALVKEVPAAAPHQKLLGIGPNADVLMPTIARLKGYKDVEWRALSYETATTSSKEQIALNETPWPFAESSFDVIVFAQSLETAGADPMRVLAETNRILKTGGALVLSAPNIASAKGLNTILRGGSPYVAGRFTAENSARPHREYTTSEIETLAHAAGFGNLQLHTLDVFWRSPDVLMASLVALGFSVGSRGDTIFLRAAKESPVRDRFPARLYDLCGPKCKAAMDPETKSPMRVLVIFETLPLTDGGGADHRLMQIVRLLREQGHAVTFLAPRDFGKETCAPALRKLGVEIRTEDAEVLKQEGVDILPKWTLQEVLREEHFDLAIVSLWFWMGVTLPEHYVDEIRRLSPSTPVAILTDDCHGIRETGAAELSGLWSDRERAADFTEREKEIYRRSDLTICISSADQKIIAREIGSVPAVVLPMMIEPGPDAPGFDDREGIVYFGHYNNPPSLDGLEWYIREVAPLVRRELPDLKLYILGAGLPEGWTTDDPNVVRLGFRLDLAPEFASRRMLISPVRFGTGIKTKNLHALAHGLPIVTNTKGADGGDFVNGETALIADDPREFAAAVVKLYRDSALWEKLSENSRAHARTHFSREAMDKALQAILERARDLRPQAYDPAHVWSMRLVEKMYLEVLNFQPAKDRHSIRVLAYARAADQFLAQGDTREARCQLRHVFNFVSHEMSRSVFFNGFLTVAESIEKTYRALGETEGAAGFRREGRMFSATAFPEASAIPAAPRTPISSPSLRSAELAAPRNQLSRQNGKSPGKLDFSVIVPTYNRAAVLRECLDALNRQSFSARRFEVIVVDDGSTDSTEQLCSAHEPRHEFQYLHQTNAGAGAARRLGVDHARGKYLLLFNDDTIASPALLTRHLQAQRNHASEKVAVLGDFKYPDAAKKRALTWFLSRHPFLFPQATLKPGIYATNSFFVTCNISVRRDLVLESGSFDPDFRVAEDTDLGIRLIQKGLRILYFPQAEATHQHLDFTIPDLIRRAQVYGNQLVRLYAKHPSLLIEDQELFGNMDANSLKKLQLYIEQREPEIPGAIESLAKFDSIDFIPFFSNKIEGKNAADEVMNLFAQSIPTVYWFHLFRSFLAARKNVTPQESGTNRHLVAS